MAKKRKIKKSAFIIIGIIIFFIIYFLAFNLGRKLDKQPESNIKKTNAEIEDTRSLLVQLMVKENIYINDEKNKDVSGIKIDKDYWNEIKYAFNEFSDIRTPDTYSELYSGYSDNGIRFSTDLSVFRVYTVNKEEYYKIPVSSKEAFENVIKKSIYTSINFVDKYKSWDKVTITSSTGDSKTLHKWKYDDLANKIVEKRMVGKVQPQKSLERSKLNFAIDIKGSGYEVRLETMGKDYVKISCNKEQSYYEVHTGLFDYIRTEIFKIEESE